MLSRRKFLQLSILFPVAAAAAACAPPSPALPKAVVVDSGSASSVSDTDTTTVPSTAPTIQPGSGGLVKNPNALGENSDLLLPTKSFRTFPVRYEQPSRQIAELPSVPWTETVSRTSLVASGFNGEIIDRVVYVIPILIQAQKEMIAQRGVSVPWQVMLAILGMEHTYQTDNPANRDGPYQVLDGSYPAGYQNTPQQFLAITKNTAQTAVVEHGKRVGVQMEVANGDIGQLSWQQIAAFAGVYNGMTPAVPCGGGRYAYGYPDGVLDPYLSGYVANGFNQLPSDVANFLGNSFPLKDRYGQIIDTDHMWVRREYPYIDCSRFVRLERDDGFLAIVAKAIYAQQLDAKRSSDEMFYKETWTTLMNFVQSYITNVTVWG